jgi:peptidoglycan/LPS O-acetylase OafA/YrhL
MAERSFTRRYDVDWLRVFATYLLFAFHAGKVFDVPPFYPLKNGQLSGAMGFFTGFVHQWHMPLFFVLAGWSAFESLAQRGGARFLRERLQKLVIPLVFGMLVLCPPIRWVELREGLFVTASGRALPAEPAVGLLAFLPRYYTPAGLTWSHLWFLAYLFTFSLLYLPLLVRLLRAPVRRIPRQSSVVYLALVPLVLAQVTLRGRWPGFQNLIDDWANFTYYSLFFLFGFALAWAPELERLAHREWKRAGLLAAAALLGMVATDLLRARGFELAVFANRALSAVAGGCAVLFLLGCAARFLVFSNRTLRWLAESAYPVYQLHQLAVVMVGLWVVTLPLSIALKYGLLVPLSLAVTLGVYQVVVKPLPVLRFCLGMKPRALARSRWRLGASDTPTPAAL